MKYSESEIRQYVAEEDVKFLRMTFFDLTGNQKNMSILPDALDRAFSAGIAFDASAIPGFGDELRSDLFLQRTPRRSVCSRGGRITGVWRACSAAFCARTARPLRVTAARCCKRR